MEVPVDIWAGLARPCISPDDHPKMFRRPGQVGADRPHAEQAQCLAAQNAGIGPLPFSSLLGRDPLEHFLFKEQQVAKYKFRHQRAEHTAGIGQHIITAHGRIHQGLDPRIDGLDPFQLRKTRQRIPDGFGLTEENVRLSGVRYDLQVRQLGGLDQAPVFVFVGREE